MPYSTELEAVRRVVTGKNKDGQSYVMDDGPIRRFAGPLIGLLWATDVGATTVPQPTDPVPQVREIFGAEGSTRLVATIIPPDSQRDFRARLTESASDIVRPDTSDHDGWHTTESVDYIIVVKGEIVCELDAGEVTLTAGDVLVQNGTRHRWRNQTEEAALVYAVPVGATFAR